MLYCPDVNSNLPPLGKVYLITENKGPGYTAFHSMPHIYMRRFLVVSSPLDDLCIDIWISAMIIQIPERQGTAMY